LLSQHGVSSASGSQIGATQANGLFRRSSASVSPARSLVYSQNGAKFRFSQIILSVSCVNLTFGTLLYQDGTSMDVSMPAHQSGSSGADLVIFCLHRAALADAAQGLPSGEHAKCANTYEACQEIGDEGNGAWVKVSEHCNKGLPHSMCEACYSAGLTTYTFLLITAVLQFPLVYLSIMRTSAAADNRYLKFWSLPIALLVVGGACISRTEWQTKCYDKLSARLDVVLTVQSLEDLAEASTEQNIWSFAPYVVAFLALLGFGFSVITPVPELYQSQCIDPESEVHENSIRFDAERDLMLSVLHDEPSTIPNVMDASDIQSCGVDSRGCC